MEPIDIMKKLSDIYVAELKRQDAIHDMRLALIELMQHFEGTKEAGGNKIYLEIDGKLHNKLKKLFSLLDGGSSQNEKI